MKYHCPKCDRNLPLDKFRASKATFDGKNRWCRNCTQRRERTRKRARAMSKTLPLAWVVAVYFEDVYSRYNRRVQGDLARMFRIPTWAVPELLRHGREQITEQITAALPQMREAA